MGTIGAIWGVTGVSLILGSAIYRMFQMAEGLFSVELTMIQWTALVGNVLFMAWSEGYKAFQLGFSPRVAARLRYLKENPTPALVVLAPLFCLGFFHATKKRKIITYSLITGLILLIMAVRLLPHPWRGIIDVGVIVGLGWGLISFWLFSIRALTASEFPFSPEVVEER